MQNAYLMEFLQGFATSEGCFPLRTSKFTNLHFKKIKIIYNECGIDIMNG